MHPHYSIRKSHLNDHSKLVNFQQEMALETEGLILDKSVLEPGVNAVLQDPAKGQYYVCESNGSLIASLMITYEWSDWRNQWVWWIQSVYVVKEWRGKGVYASMYQYLQELVKNSNTVSGLRLYVDKRNLPANAVYQKLGMDGNHYAMFEWIPNENLTK